MNINPRNPWKNCWTIRLVCAIDIAFACLLVSIYLQKFLSNITHEVVYSETSRIPSLKLFLLGPIILNSFQIIMSFNLFSAARRGSEPLISYAKATTWFQFSTVILVFLALKLFLILWFPPHGSVSRRDIFGATMIVLETVFKIFGLFVVKEFIDDLKFLLSMFPPPHFYCIYAPPAPASFPASGNSGANRPSFTNNNMSANYTYPVVSFPQDAPSAPQHPTSQPLQNRDSTIITVV